MIWRARRGAERQHLLLQERQQAILGQHRRRCLEQKALVGGTAALGHEHELVGVIALGVDLALRRHVVGGVLFLIHRQGRHLRIAQVTAQVSVARAFRERGLVVAVGDDVAALLAHDDRGAGVLAHRQHAAGGDVGVLQEIEGDELVVVAGFLVVQDRAQLLQVPRAQIVIDVAEGGLRQRPQRLARHHQHVLAKHLLDPHALGRDLLVGRGVRPQRKQRRVLVGRNGLLVGKGGRGVHVDDLGLEAGGGPERRCGDRPVLSIFRTKGRFCLPERMRPEQAVTVAVSAVEPFRALFRQTGDFQISPEPIAIVMNSATTLTDAAPGPGPRAAAARALSASDHHRRHRSLRRAVARADPVRRHVGNSGPRRRRRDHQGVHCEPSRCWRWRRWRSPPSAGCATRSWRSARSC